MRNLPNKLLQMAALAALIVSAPILAGTLHAQAPEGPDTTSSTTDDSTGKLTAITPNQTVTVDSRRGPFTYRLGRDLHIAGPDGKPMKIDKVRAGQTVTVYYYMRDGQATVARLVVLKEAKAK